MRRAAKDEIGGNHGLVASAELAFFRAAANERRVRCALRLQGIHHFVDSRASSEKFLPHLGVWDANQGTPMLFNDETRRHRLRAWSRRRLATASLDDEGRKYTPACCFTPTRDVISNILVLINLCLLSTDSYGNVVPIQLVYEDVAAV